MFLHGDYVDVRMAAERLQVSQFKITSAINQFNVPYEAIGHTKIYKLSDIRYALDSLGNVAVRNSLGFETSGIKSRGRVKCVNCGELILSGVIYTQNKRCGLRGSHAYCGSCLPFTLIEKPRVAEEEGQEEPKILTTF